MRIGLGVDVHAFGDPDAKRHLVLGGVKIDHTQCLDGHSDADALVHAIMDALLGAARLGDIGDHFPPTDPAYKNADSIELLKQIKVLLDQHGWLIEDLDCVIIAQEPRLSPHRDKMRATIAEALNVSVEKIGVKATTSEYLGFEGRKEGLSAYAVALLQPAE